MNFSFRSDFFIFEPQFKSQLTYSGKILVTDAVHDLLIEGLENHGFTCDYRPKIQTNDVLEVIENYVGLVINSKILVDDKLLDKGKQLKFVARLGSGMEIVDIPAAIKRGVKVHKSPEGNCNAVAEHAVGMLLCLANNLRKADREVRSMVWEREANRGFELEGKTIGIIGYGHTGSAFARKLQGWDMNILVYDKYKTGFCNPQPNIKEVALADIFDQADILSLHIPLTAETKGMVDQAFIERFKKPIILINTSRGPIVQTADLIAALKSGKLSGACLDVFENEKPHTFTDNEDEMYSELYGFENTVFSPHVAGWTVESKRKLASYLLERILSNY